MNQRKHKKSKGDGRVLADYHQICKMIDIFSQANGLILTVASPTHGGIMIKPSHWVNGHLAFFRPDDEKEMLYLIANTIELEKRGKSEVRVVGVTPHEAHYVKDLLPKLERFIQTWEFQNVR